MGWKDKWKIINQEEDTWCFNKKFYYWSPKRFMEKERVCKMDWLLTTFTRLAMRFEGIKTKAIFLQGKEE